jgi:hypothetical protein
MFPFTASRGVGLSGSLIKSTRFSYTRNFLFVFLMGYSSDIIILYDIYPYYSDESE